MVQTFNISISSNNYAQPTDQLELIKREKNKIEYLVEQYMFPYLRGQVTRETESVDRIPLFEMLKNKLHPQVEQYLTWEKEIQQIAFNEYHTLTNVNLCHCY